MKLSKTHAFILIMHLTTVGLLFGVFTIVTRISTFWPSFASIILYTLAINPKVFFKRTVLYSVMLFFVLLIFDYCDHFNNLPEVRLQPFGIFTFVYLYLFVAIIIENLIALKGSKQATQSIGKFALIILVLGSLITIISEFKFPGIARSIGSFKNVPAWAWSISFGTIYGLSVVLLSIIALYRGNIVYMLMITALFVLTLIKAAFMTALVISMFCLILGLLLRFNVKRKALVISCMVLFIALVLFNLDYILSLLPNLPSDIYQKKAKDIFELQQASGVTEFITNFRYGVYHRSIDAFLGNPFWGSGDYNVIGQHSYLIDRLGFIGIFGTLCYVITLFAIFKRSILLLNEDDRQIYRYIWAIIFIIQVLNPFESPDFLLIIFVLIPCIINYLKMTPFTKKGYILRWN